MPILSKSQVKKLIDGRDPLMSPGQVVKTLVNQGYQLEGLDDSPSSVPYTPKNQNPSWLSNIADGLYTTFNAPGAALGGAVMRGIGAGAGALGLKGVQQAALNSPDSRNLVKNATATLDRASTYGTIIGSGVGAPGIGGAAGQAITELGHDFMGDNPNTGLQQFGNVGLAGLSGKIAGGNPTSIYGTAARSAAADAVTQAGRDVLGNNPLTAEQQIQSVATSGLLGGTAAAAGKIVAPTVEGGMQGGAKGAIQGFNQGLRDVSDDLASPMRMVSSRFQAPNLDKVIDDGLDQGIRPSRASKGDTLAQNKQFRANSRQAVKDIVANKNELELTDTFGEAKKTGTVPESLHEFQSANDQMLHKLFQAYDDIKQGTEGRGVMISTEPVANAFHELADNPVIKTRYPALAEQAEVFANRYRTQLPYITPSQAQEITQMVNAQLGAAQKSMNPNDISTAALYALEKNTLGKALGDAIESEADTPLYMELKKAYASQKSIQTDIARRLITFSRQNPKGLIDYANIGSAREAAFALSSFDPRYIATAVGTLAMKKWLKYQNDPNIIVRDMFRKVDKYLQATELPILQRANKMTPETLTPEEKATGLVGGGGDNMPKAAEPSLGSLDSSAGAAGAERAYAEKTSLEQYLKDRAAEQAKNPKK